MGLNRKLEHYFIFHFQSFLAKTKDILLKFEMPYFWTILFPISVKQGKWEFSKKLSDLCTYQILTSKKIRDITNLLFWVLWAYLAMTNKNDIPACRKLWYLSSCKESYLSLPSFLKYCKRCCKLFILGTLGMPSHIHQKQ